MDWQFHEDHGMHFTTKKQTMNLRWNAGVLEQLHLIQGHADGAPPGVIREEWLPVPDAPTNRS